MAITEALKQNTSVRLLHLDGNQIGAAGARAIGTATVVAVLAHCY